jgi:RNA polymerase sigma factor (sigma-70 family)
MTAQLLWDHDAIDQQATLFEENLDAIERAIAQVCRSVRLYDADAEDFASAARLALLADDCAILRKWEGRSSFGGYVGIVVRHLFIEQKRSAGRWYASAEATRRGEAVVLLERLLRHEGRSLAEAVTVTKEKYPDADVRQLEAAAAALPERALRPRLVPVAEGDDERFAGDGRADDLVTALDLKQRSERTSRAVQAAFAAMSPQDRVALRLRFGKGLAVADIARALGIEQRPLYRRMEALLAELRRELQRAGIDAVDAAELIGLAGERLDFGLTAGKSDGVQPSVGMEQS